ALSGSPEQPIVLPAKTTSFRDWARHLHDHAQTEEITNELPYWLEAAGATTPVPLDTQPAGKADGREVNTLASVDTVAVSLDAEHTRALLQDVPPVYRTQINDALLSALAQALAPWLGTRRMTVELEGHGREDLGPQLDLSRTVGWFTSIYPVLLDVGPEDDQGAMLKRIKEQLRSVPNRGLGDGLLRHLAEHPAAQTELRNARRPDIVFNYLGQSDQVFQGESDWGPAPEAAGPAHDRDEPRQHLLAISAMVTGGRLEMAWTYQTKLHRRETITAVAERFIAALRELVTHCRAPESGGWTPSDFPLARLDQAALDRVLADAPNVEDVYTLSPLQQGMLFHTLLHPANGVYVEQFNCRLGGTVDGAALRRAFQQAVDRHPTLRTSFHWSEIATPVQVVHQGVELPWEQLDWSGLPPADQEARLASLLREDRLQGFRLDRPPLLRARLVRLADGRHQLLLTHHHVLLDGWSFSRVLAEVLAAYVADRGGESRALPAQRPFRQFIAWLQQQDEGRAENFWRERLAGFTTPSDLPLCRPATDDTADDTADRYAPARLALSTEATDTLRQLARDHQLTLNTLLQAAWALLLSRYSGEQDVLHGMTVAGRPADLPGVEDMVGLFINTVPVRTQVQPHLPAGDWLRRIQLELTELRQYEYSPLTQVQSWSEVPRESPLFESVVVFENYPAAGSGKDPDFAGMVIEQARAVEQTNFPVTLVAVPGSALGLQLIFDHHRLAPQDATTLL
ncbi:non-ribosomal peptide synthetase, partial [Streptomyces sp. CB01881]|uniref:condensation domain-containing protein n=1 Tax=Streptomyces sp. CB01881 TaxID=2078691 RepID=UPI0013A1B373